MREKSPVRSFSKLDDDLSEKTNTLLTLLSFSGEFQVFHSRKSLTFKGAKTSLSSDCLAISRHTASIVFDDQMMLSTKAEKNGIGNKMNWLSKMQMSERSIRKATMALM